MKANELIRIITEQINKHGEDLEVFIEAPGFNSEATYSTKDTIYNYVTVENLDEQKPHLIMEKHGYNKGIIYAICLRGDEQIEDYN